MIYENIKELADKKGIPISKLEEKSGLTNGTIAKWRTCEPGALKLKAVAKTLGVTVNRLLRGAERKKDKDDERNNGKHSSH